MGKDLQKSQKGLLCQNKEINFPGYKEQFNFIKEQLPYKPDFFSRIDPNNLIAVNAGVIGGSDLIVFKNLKKEVFKFLKMIKIALKEVNMNRLNCVIEQLFIYYIAQSERVEITSLFDNMTSEYTEILKMANLPFNNKYVHLIGDTKGFPTYCKTMEAIFQYEFPKEYDQYIKLLDNKKLDKDCHYIRWVKNAFDLKSKDLNGRKLILSSTTSLIEKENSFSMKYFDFDQGKYILNDNLSAFEEFFILFQEANSINESLVYLLENTNLETDELETAKRAYEDFIKNNVLITRILCFAD